METLLSRYRNVSILVAVLFAQVVGLAVQVRRSSHNESSRLIRVWAVMAVTPLERAIVWVQEDSGNLWSNYVYLRGVRQQNRNLKYEIESLRLQQVRLTEDANQARRLQALLGFKEQFIAKTVAAQVIGATGSEHSRAVYIDKGSDDGIRNDMAVITADGVVGKVLQVFDAHTSMVLLINDQSSGVGAILAKSRLQGILQGTPAGEVMLEKILSDEQVQPGEQVLTSGGDQIFPKGLPAGVVTSVSKGPDAFLNIRVRPAADLGKLEEVLVITKEEHRMPEVSGVEPTRAADILARRLPSVPDKPAEAANSQTANKVVAPTAPAGAAAAGSVPPIPQSIQAAGGGPKPHAGTPSAAGVVAAPKTKVAAAPAKPAPAPKTAGAMKTTGVTKTTGVLNKTSNQTPGPALGQTAKPEASSPKPPPQPAQPQSAPAEDKPQ
jgi:rod shape-determining protein MreC